MQSLPSHQKLFSGSLAAVKKTVSGISFLFLNSLHKGHLPSGCALSFPETTQNEPEFMGSLLFFFFLIMKMVYAWY